MSELLIGVGAFLLVLAAARSRKNVSLPVPPYQELPPNFWKMNEQNKAFFAVQAARSGNPAGISYCTENKIKFAF